MSDCHRVWIEVEKKLKQMYGAELVAGVEKHRRWIVLNQLKVLSLMIAGIVVGGSARLAWIAREAPVRGKNPSIMRRLQRFVANKLVRVLNFYKVIALHIVRIHRKGRLEVVIDASQVGIGCMMLMVGLVCGNRALPLCWEVYEAEKGHLGAARHIEVLSLLLELVGADTSLALMGDGEFDSPTLIKWLRANTSWNFVLRTAKSSKVARKNGEFQRVESFHVEEGKIRLMPNMSYTASEQVESLSIAAWWGMGEKEPIYLVTDLEDAQAVSSFYGKRPLIETLFSDQKSRGFGIDRSHLRDPERINRLLLATCIAYIWMVWLGNEVVQDGLESFLEAKSRPQLSLFRLGLDYLKYLLKHDQPLSVSFSVPIIA